MAYKPDIHHRRSIRLKEYDYSKAGAYFITVCAQNRVCLFGDVKDDRIVMNEAGEMISRWWRELCNKYRSIDMAEFIVMPNHVHGIVIFVGADLCVCPGARQEGEHIGSPLHRIVQWFKTMTTNEYIRGIKTYQWPPFSGKLWQRNYYEHIIRDEEELNRIREYIVNNPLRWHCDKENPVGIQDNKDHYFWEQPGDTDSSVTSHPRVKTTHLNENETTPCTPFSKGE